MEMIDSAALSSPSSSIELGVAARIGKRRYEPGAPTGPTRSSWRAALAEHLGEKSAWSSRGEGERPGSTPDAVPRGISARWRQAALRHGGLEQVELRVDGATLTISPRHSSSGTGPARGGAADLGAAVAVIVIRRESRLGVGERRHAGGQAPGVSRAAQVSLLRWLRRQLQQPTPTREHLGGGGSRTTTLRGAAACSPTCPSPKRNAVMSSRCSTRGRKGR